MRNDVYRKVRGQKVTKFIAVQPVVQTELDTEVRKAAVKAEAVLASRPGGRSGGFSGGAFSRRRVPSFITTDRGRVDRYLILNDEAGDSGAWSIEMGRTGGHYRDYNDDGSMIGSGYVPPMDPVAPLRKSVGLF